MIIFIIIIINDGSTYSLINSEQNINRYTLTIIIGTIWLQVLSIHFKLNDVLWVH